jgi:thymidine kinase
LSTAYDFEEKGVEILVLKSSKDTRDGSDTIRSRAGLTRRCISVDDGIDLYEVVKAYDEELSKRDKKLKWVLVDECQFLTEDQVDELSDAVDYLGVNVICYGLRTDFMSRSFPASRRLFEIADDIEEVKSTCECGERKTSINARFDENGDIVTEGEQVLVGGNETYKPICRRCWKEKIREKIIKEDD